MRNEVGKESTELALLNCRGFRTVTEHTSSTITQWISTMKRLSLNRGSTAHTLNLGFAATESTGWLLGGILNGAECRIPDRNQTGNISGAEPEDWSNHRSQAVA